MKNIKIFSLLLCFVIFILLTACSLFSLNRENKNTSEAFSSITYSEVSSSANSSISSKVESDTFTRSNTKKSTLKLHDSTLAPPTEEQCKTAQQKVLSNLSDENKKTVQSEIRRLHMHMEYKFVEANMREKLKNSSSPSWEYWEHTGTIVDSFGTKVNNQYDGACLIKDLQKIYDIVQDMELRTNIQKMQELTSDAVSFHNIDKLDDLHKMLHDCDYWAVNYPVHFEKVEPPDWGGIYVYFNSLQSIKTDEK